MILIPYLHFFCLMVYAFMAGYIIYKDPKSILNRTLAILMVCFSIWNMVYLLPTENISMKMVYLIQNLTSIGWIGFPCALFCFSLYLSKKEKLFRSKIFMSIILVLPLILIYKQWTDCMLIDPVPQVYGWSYSWASTIWTYLFYIYYITFTILSIYFIYQYGENSGNVSAKKQSRIIVPSLSLALIGGSFFDVMMPLLNVHSIPPMANIFIFVFAMSLVYAIVKYRFLSLTPAIAAENIISAMDEFLILLNQEAEILTVNKATLDSLYYDQKELEGKSIKMLFQEDHFREILFQKIKNEEVIKNHDGDFLTKNGGKVPIIYSSSPLKNEEQTIIGTVFIARDITERKKIEEELIKSKVKAEESDRLKLAFLANMSHEIRTPMNGILGFADLLKLPDLTGETQLKYIRIIEKSGARMLNIINDIIDISKIESGLMEVSIKDSDINEQIEYIYNFFKPEVEGKGLQLSYMNTLPSNKAIIKTDREKLYAILINLVKNAIKYTKKGSIEFGYHLKKKKDYAELEFFVKDTGIGIPENRQEAIFERFVQADIENKNALQGAGLGLSITKAYVEMLGGEIWLESENDKGSIFYFTIPYQIETEKKLIVEEVYSNEYSEIHLNPEVSGLKVLIVEDDETSGTLISIIIKTFCKDVLKAINGTEAIEICRTNPDIDLIFMDIQMPVLNGYETTQQIRQFNKDVIIIAQTAFGLFGDREKAIEAGCNDYISKPINKNELLALIQKYFNKSTEIN